MRPVIESKVGSVNHAMAHRASRPQAITANGERFEGRWIEVIGNML